VDEARLDLFAQKQRAYNAIPPTKGALKQHIKRARSCLGSSNCYHVTTATSVKLWMAEAEQCVSYWTELSAIAESCQELQKDFLYRKIANATAQVFHAQHFVLTTVKKITKRNICIVLLRLEHFL